MPLVIGKINAGSSCSLVGNRLYLKKEEMNAKLTLKQRILVGFVLALAFFLVLGSNLVDRRHFSTIHKTIESIHDDRVVVQDYIYQLRNFLHDTEVGVLGTGKIAISNERDKQITAILDDFAETELTREEATFLKRLRQQFSSLGSNSSSSLRGQGAKSILPRKPWMPLRKFKSRKVDILPRSQKNH